MSDVNGFLADVAQTSIAGLAHALKDSAADLFDGARQKVLASATASASTMAATAAPTSIPSTSLVDTGIGTHWLRNLLGRSEWTLPCVGVKLVL